MLDFTPILCISCTEHRYINISTEQHQHWLRNKGELPHVQDHFPHLDADSRELLISGLCARCWDDIMEGSD